MTICLLLTYKSNVLNEISQMRIENIFKHFNIHLLNFLIYGLKPGSIYIEVLHLEKN